MILLRIPTGVLCSTAMTTTSQRLLVVKVTYYVTVVVMITCYVSKMLLFYTPTSKSTQGYSVKNTVESGFTSPILLGCCIYRTLALNRLMWTNPIWKMTRYSDR